MQSISVFTLSAACKPAGGCFLPATHSQRCSRPPRRSRFFLRCQCRFSHRHPLINVVGSFVIGYFGTLTLHSGRYPASDNVRLFVMVGICGGFTTFSSFSLQTFDLIRFAAWGRPWQT
jgi:hypothetical protein